jgi:hypothetical protein
MFCKEPAGYGAERLAKNKEAVEVREKTVLVSNLTTVLEEVHRNEGSRVSFTVPKNTCNFAFYVMNDKNQSQKTTRLLAMWESLGKV